MSSLNKEETNVQKQYGDDNFIRKEDIFKKYETSEEGLNSKQVVEKTEKYGINELKQKKEKKWYNYFLKSLFGTFNLILFGITLVLIYTDIILSEENSYANIIVILCLILISTLLEFVSEYRSNKAASKLKSLVETTATVIRNGEEKKIPVKNITIGDLISLSAGDMIPADLRIIESKDLYVGQSSLTGESDSVRKFEQTEIENKQELESITDLDTICFMGTNVISGSGKGVVIKISNDTYFGKVSKTISEGKPKTAFQKGIENVSKLLVRFMLVIISITFLVNVWKHEILTAFTFSVAIAIGITPLLLPVILSSCMAKGATLMSKKKTIVKKLDSIQSFGSMNILCTDKTGTLTEDKIVLEKYLNVNGEEDTSVLKYAYLNAYFQTGLKGNIDEAIIKRANENKIDISQYQKIDEIPFDFSRRRLSVVVSDGDKKRLITKGAVEEILSICTMAEYKGEISPLTNNIKDNIKKIARDLNKQGMRVVAVCERNNIENIATFSINDENKMILKGFIGFLDPPKESAKGAIKRLNDKGIRVIVLTGDNADVTECICKKVNINTSRIVLGSEIEKMSDIAISRILKKVNVFAKLSPIQKARIVRLLKENGNIVGYMGDGINDSPSLTNADVGISVDSAVDIAKETADIILLEKDLNVLIDGVIEGRKTFCNLMKYIKMAVSFNFGEVLSVLIASIVLPFLPITPIQLLVQSLLYDLGQISLPFDNVDEEYLDKPRVWSMDSLKKFMLTMGPTSSIFDLMIFATLWFGFGFRTPEVALFQTIWFSYGVVSNLVGLHLIRTSKINFFKSKASKYVYATSFSLSCIALLLPSTIIGSAIGLTSLSLKFVIFILFVPAVYCIVATIVKKHFIRKYNEWI